MRWPRATFSRASATSASGLSTASDHESGTLSRTRPPRRSEEHTSELQSHSDLVCRLLHESAPPEISTLSLPDALPISDGLAQPPDPLDVVSDRVRGCLDLEDAVASRHLLARLGDFGVGALDRERPRERHALAHAPAEEIGRAHV